MPSFSLWFDPLTAFATYAIAVVSTLLWVFRSKQTLVPANNETARRVATRIAIIVGCVTVACYFVDVAFYVPVLVFLALILAALSGDSLGVVGLPAVLLAAMLKEYVLGFPELALAPPDPSEADKDAEHRLQSHIGQTAFTSSPLKPNGEIELSDVRFPAASESGDFIDKGMTVVVHSVRNGTLVVCLKTPVSDPANATGGNHAMNRGWPR